LTGLDINAWALEETQWTYASWGLRGQTRKLDLKRYKPNEGDAFIAGFVLNELPHAQRDSLLNALIASGKPTLVIEPIARRPLPWWTPWERKITELGGRSDTWTFNDIVLPNRLALLDKAAGLRHRALKARTMLFGV